MDWYNLQLSKTKILKKNRPNLKTWVKKDDHRTKDLMTVRREKTSKLLDLQADFAENIEEVKRMNTILLLLTVEMVIAEKSSEKQQWIGSLKQGTRKTHPRFQQKIKRTEWKGNQNVHSNVRKQPVSWFLNLKSNQYKFWNAKVINRLFNATETRFVLKRD